MPLDAREAHVMLFAGIELLINAPVKAGNLAFEGGDPLLNGGNLIAQSIQAPAHIGPQVVHAFGNKLGELLDGVDLPLSRRAVAHTKQ